MIKNYLGFIVRHSWKNKNYTLLNIFGLAIGIACAALILLWVEDEVNWDGGNTKKDRLYFVRENQHYENYTATFYSTPAQLAPAMQAEMPGIANTCRTSEGDDPMLFAIGDRSMYANGRYADPSLFSMFTLPFVQGSAATAFTQLHSIVITESTAKKFFGNEKEVVGKTVRVSNKEDYVITGVLKDMPGNSSLQFEWVAPFEVFYKKNSWLNLWGNNSISTYVELKKGVDPASINKQLYNFIQQRDPGSIARPFLFGMPQWRLYDKFEGGKQTGGGRIEYVRLFSIIAAIILLIACINFMNLATARSEKRAREVGVRKVLGAERKGLVAQFMGEALFIAFLSVLTALVILSLVLPAFNTLVQKDLSLQPGNPLHLGALLLIALVCGLTAGSYPSLYLSSFQPVAVLKGLRIKSGGAAFVRKGLVVLQFSVSIALIVSTLIIYQQIQHVKNRNLGFNKNNLVEMNMRGRMAKNFAVIQEDLLQTGVVENVALSDHTTLFGGNNTSGFTWDGKAPGAKILVSTRYVTPSFMATTGLHIVQGRDLQESDTLQSKRINVVITQSMARIMNKKEILGQTIRYEGDTSGVAAVVVGVVNDYVYGDMYGSPDPVMFLCTTPGNTSTMYTRLKAGADIEQALAKMGAVMKKHNPAYPFSYTFVDDQFNRMFTNEMLISKLSRVFAALAIVISCLGLLGLAAHTAERRTREIGIRKVLGASVPDIAGLLSKDFMKLVLIAAVIAFPIAWLTMHRWLQGYAYRVDIRWWVFIAAGAAASLIAIGTISLQAVKAAIANPVKSLRTE